MSSRDSENPSGKSDKIFHFLATFIAGGTSASLAVTAMAPLERVKLLLQTQKGAINIKREKEYKGILDCMVRIPKEQGFFAFWRGNWASILRCFPYQALNFSLKEIIKENIIPHSHSLLPRLAGNIFAGGVAGCAALVVIYPLDYARTKLAVDIGTRQTRQYRGVGHCLVSTFRHSGIKAIYRGFVFSLFGVFLYRSIYFGLYDTIMECVRPEYAHSLWIEFPAAELSATSSGFISYPFDTVRRQMMIQSVDSHNQCPTKPKYKSTMDCVRKIHAAEGVRGFFHGGLANIYRGTGGAIMLVLYDNIQRWILGEHQTLGEYLPEHHPEYVSRQGEFSFRSYFTKPPCKVFKERCVFCNF